MAHLLPASQQPLERVAAGARDEGGRDRDVGQVLVVDLQRRSGVICDLPPRHTIAVMAGVATRGPSHCAMASSPQDRRWQQQPSVLQQDRKYHRAEAPRPRWPAPPPDSCSDYLRHYPFLALPPHGSSSCKAMITNTADAPTCRKGPPRRPHQTHPWSPGPLVQLPSTHMFLHMMHPPRVTHLIVFIRGLHGRHAVLVVYHNHALGARMLRVPDLRIWWALHASEQLLRQLCTSSSFG